VGWKNLPRTAVGKGAQVSKLIFNRFFPLEIRGIPGITGATHTSQIIHELLLCAMSALPDMP